MTIDTVVDKDLRLIKFDVCYYSSDERKGVELGARGDKNSNKIKKSTSITVNGVIPTKHLIKVEVDLHYNCYSIRIKVTSVCF